MSRQDGSVFPGGKAGIGLRSSDMDKDRGENMTEAEDRNGRAMPEMEDLTRTQRGSGKRGPTRRQLKTSLIPKTAIRKRLPLYLRCLTYLHQMGIENISSQNFGEKIGIDPSQIRRDLSYFGDFGKQGVGYNVENLLHELKTILGLNQRWKVVLVGVGNLGQALVNYSGLQYNFDLMGVFDTDPEKIGSKVGDHEVQDIKKVSSTIQKNGVKLAILAVPKAAAQEVGDILAASGIKGILNFAPVSIRAPGNVIVHNADLSFELQNLVFSLIYSLK